MLQTVKQYVASGVIRKEQGFDIIAHEDSEAILNALSQLVSIDDSVEDRIWRFIRYNETKRLASRDDDNKCLDVHDRKLLECIIFAKGMLTRENAVSKHFPYREEVCDNAADALRDFEYIDVHVLKNHRVVYMLNLKFFNKVVNIG
jgi:hypothetical protein